MTRHHHAVGSELNREVVNIVILLYGSVLLAFLRRRGRSIATSDVMTRLGTNEEAGGLIIAPMWSFAFHCQH
ncbi:hypothetical protein ACHQM5_002420 [Ranunculus cassubicifolius]